MEKKTGSSEAEVPRGWCLWCSTKLKTHKPTFREHYGEDDGRLSDGHPLHTPERCREVLARLREALIDVNAHLASECAALRANLTSVQARGTQLVEELRKAREELARTEHLRQLSAAEVNAVRREQRAMRPSGLDHPFSEADRVSELRGPHMGCTCGITGWRGLGPDHAETCPLYTTVRRQRANAWAKGDFRKLEIPYIIEAGFDYASGHFTDCESKGTPPCTCKARYEVEIENANAEDRGSLVFTIYIHADLSPADSDDFAVVQERLQIIAARHGGTVAIKGDRR